jgi:hypothetical protein
MRLQTSRRSFKILKINENEAKANKNELEKRLKWYVVKVREKKISIKKSKLEKF